MTDNVAETLRPFVTAAFREKAIRSVVLVDEEFDSLHELLADEEIEVSDNNEKAEASDSDVIEKSPIQNTASNEADPTPSTAQVTAAREFPNAVARRLYDEMHSANLICDVINRPEQWNGDKITNADLIVLDWHLSGGREDTSEAIGILRQLAKHSRFNLVVVYTNHDDLSQAARQLCGSLRQRTSNPDEDVEANFTEIVELFDSMHPPIAEMRDAFLLGKQLPREFCREFKKACATKFQLNGNQLAQVVQLLIEKQLREELRCSLGDEDNVPLKGVFEANQPWLVYENLFVCFASKVEQQLKILDVLDESLVAWNPGIPRTIVSEIRNAISRKRHEFGDDFPHDLETQAGWLWHAQRSRSAGKEGVRRLLQGVLRSFQERVLSDDGLESFVESVLAVIPQKATPREQVEESVRWCGDGGDSSVDPQSVMHALNVFQSSAAFSGDYITTGTILKRKSGSHPEWLVVVEPACNLVPSQGQGNAKYISCRMLQLVKVSAADIAIALDGAAHGRHLFVQIDRQRLYFLIGNPDASLQPMIVDSFVPRTTQFRDDGAELVLDVHFPDLRPATPTSSKSEYQIVAQLHEPYANRLLHSIGAHLSRIGLDFVSFPKLQQEGEQPQ